jgi:hypothetical protein
MIQGCLPILTLAIVDKAASKVLILSSAKPAA